jgi:hypothetical protein
MNLKELQDYSYWIGKTPKEILNAVRQLKGGWAEVFPDKLPVWAHRVRNYFNREPANLWAFNVSEAKSYIGRVHRKRPPQDIKEEWALSGPVYKDDESWIWYQMTEGGGIYHWGSNPRIPDIEAPWQEFKAWLGKPAPIFKLIAPDGTGGSRETIFRNPYNMFTVVKKVHFWALVAHLTVFHEWHGGSYNYSETVAAGSEAHELRDVIPHDYNQFSGVYINPPDRRSLLSARVFPARAPNDHPRRLPLAKQIDGVI